MATNGTPEGLSARQRRAVAALLSERDAKAAAAAARVGYRTLCRWLTEPAFRQAVLQAEDQAIDQATRRLAGMADEAVDALRGLLARGGVSDSVRLRTAQVVMDGLLKLRELRTLEERVAALERKLEERR